MSVICEAKVYKNSAAVCVHGTCPHGKPHEHTEACRLRGCPKWKVASEHGAKVRWVECKEVVVRAVFSPDLLMELATVT